MKQSQYRPIDKVYMAVKYAMSLVVLVFICLIAVPLFVGLLDVGDADWLVSYCSVMRYVSGVMGILLLVLCLVCVILKPIAKERQSEEEKRLIEIGHQIQDIEARLSVNEKNVQLLEDERRERAQSPLIGLTAEQKANVVDKLKVVAMPLKGDGKLNRSRTVQFLRALQLKGLIDSSFAEEQLRLWTEQVTGYREANHSAFNDSYRKATQYGGNVAQFMEEIDKLLS